MDVCLGLSRDCLCEGSCVSGCPQQTALASFADSQPLLLPALGLLASPSLDSHRMSISQRSAAPASLDSSVSVDSTSGLDDGESGVTDCSNEVLNPIQRV